MAILRNASSTQEQLGNALEALRYLVEPIDNANSECLCVCAAVADRRPRPVRSICGASAVEQRRGGCLEHCGLLWHQPHPLPILPNFRAQTCKAWAAWPPW